MFKKVLSVFAAGVIAASAVTASLGCMTVEAGAAKIDISEEYEILKSGKEINLTLEPRQNASTSETIIYKLPVGESGTLHMDISSDTYYVQASFVKKQVAHGEEIDNEGITVSMTEGECFNRYNGDVNFIWDWSSRKSAGSCEFSVEPAEYFVGFTVYYDSKGNEPVPFDKLKDEFGSGKITVKLTYPFDKNASDSNSGGNSSYDPYNIEHYGIDLISDKVYTGKAIKPTVKIYDEIVDMSGNHIKTYLVKGTDYTVSYKNNTKIGTATVTINGKGKYNGTKTVEFKIVPKKVTLKGSVSDNEAALSWKKVKGATGYEVYRSVNGGAYKKLTDVKTTKYTAKLSAGTSYKYKVRAYAVVNGKRVYGSWSKVIKA